MRTSVKDAGTILNLLLEGMSIRAASRITGVKHGTICDLILHVGANCRKLLDRMVNGVAVKDVQCDELWSFVAMKERQRKSGNFTGDEGDSWTWVAIDRQSKLVLAHRIGQRDNYHCEQFLRKLYNATTGRFQISTDGLGAYTLNVPFTRSISSSGGM